MENISISQNEYIYKGRINHNNQKDQDKKFEADFKCRVKTSDTTRTAETQATGGHGECQPLSIIFKSLTPAEVRERKFKQIRVAAYCRVSTDSEEQANSYQVQIEYYTNLINSNPEWTMAGIFADEGISGTQTKNRKQFNKMIRKCQQKKIDLVLCKSISRFARNTVDCLEYIRELRLLGIGVIFEKENINTMMMTANANAYCGEFIISLYGSFAQAESESISKIVSWGIEKSFREGKVKYVLDKTLGYRMGEDGVPYLQKSYTIDCITHKRVKNNGEKNKYIVHECHFTMR